MPPLRNPTLGIVIVNWNSKNQLRECLESIRLAEAELDPIAQLSAVVVVDNGSTDGSTDLLDSIDIPLILIRNRANAGFAAACNQGAASAGRCDYLLFLNPDTRLFEQSLRIPLVHLQQHAFSQVGICGIQLIDDGGEVARSCARFPKASQFASQALGLDRLLPGVGHSMREWDHRSSRPVDQVIGAYFLVRGEVFAALQGFDERFFVYFEEVDFALRAKQLGWDSMYFADVNAFHKGGGTSDQVKGRRLFYSLRSRLAFFGKHGSWPQRLLIGLTTWLLEPVARAVHLLLAGRITEFGNLAEGYWLLILSRSSKSPDSGC